MSTILNVTNLQKVFPEFRINNLSFDLPTGYVLGIIGENGSGKSSLIKTILGLYAPTSGTILIDGHDRVQDGKEAKRRMSFILDECPFPLEFHPLDLGNLFGPEYDHWNKTTFINYLDRFEVPQKKKLSKLSKGQIIKFQLAFALSYDSKLLVMDEPLSGLDPVFRTEFFDLLYEELSGNEKSILYSTNAYEDIEQFSDYILLLHNGTQVLFSDKEQLMSQYQLVRGSAEQIRCIPSKLIVGTRITENASEALVRNSEELPKLQFQVEAASIESIVYYLLKEQGVSL